MWLMPRQLRGLGYNNEFMVREKLAEVRQRMDAAARAGERDPAAVRLVAVTKGVPVAHIEEALAAGVREIGENRVQEAEAKQPAIGRRQGGAGATGASSVGGTGVRWHLIGHLQRNKAKQALELFDLIQSVDRAELAEVLQKSAESLGRASVEVLVEVNVSRLPQRSGVMPEAAESLVEQVRRFGRLNLIGLMAIAPLVENPEEARPYFRQMRELAHKFGLKELSMGMSQDYEVAIQEGATIVRVGSAIFK